VPSITVARGPRAVAVGFLLIGSVFVVAWVWDSLSWHARGMILAAYGVTVLVVGLVPALRTRGLLRSGARAQGTVVGAEQETSQGKDFTTYYYHPVVRFTAPDGRQVEFTSAMGSQRAPDLGVSVPVRYRPDNPQQAELDRAVMWVLPAAFGLVGGLGLLVAAVVVYAEEPQGVPAVVDTVGGTEAALEPVPEPRSPSPKVASGKVGDTLTAYDQSGMPQLEVMVARVKFSTGDQFDQPEHGLFMGAYVAAHAVGDEQEVLDIVALVGGHLYEETITVSTAFDPSLDFLPFNEGERASGWLVFDVPARHGKLVMRDLDEHQVGVWTF
jgi:Protein of unknown function (DUF3592)